MNLILTLINFFLVLALLFRPPETPLAEVQPLLLLLLALLGINFAIQSVALLRRRFFGKQEGEAPERPAEEPRPVEKPQPAVGDAAIEAGVVQFVSRLQEKGRLIDFIMDDIAPYSNEQVGTAARVVHQGCREVLQSTFDIRPVHGGREGDAVTLAGDFDAGVFRLVGKVPERPPFTGTVVHRGWKTARISLPHLAAGADQRGAREIIAPAEVEVG